MNTKWFFILLTCSASSCQAASTINPSNHFAHGANLGWIDARADATNGAVIGEFVCSGYLYAANVGWINLGNGSPANGICYQNAVEFGVNHDGLGTLRGYGYGANIGWLNFTNRDATGAFYEGPKVDLFTGRVSGFIWSANCGWISLSNAYAVVQTDFMRAGLDSDGDGLTDAWELFHFGNLTVADGRTDFDGDNFSDFQEYLSDTDPRRSDSNLRITSLSLDPVGTTVALSWTSRPTRQYQILKRMTFAEAPAWADSGLGLLWPGAGESTTYVFPEPAMPLGFFRVQAVRPLSR